MGRRGGDGETEKGAAAGGLVLLSQNKARFPVVPTLTATLGVKVHRPVVGPWDSKHLLHVFAVVNVSSTAVYANQVDSPKDAKAKHGKGRTRRMQDPFAAQLRHVARQYPAAEHRQVVLVIDNAPWQRGRVIEDALRDHPAGFRSGQDANRRKIDFRTNVWNQIAITQRKKTNQSGSAGTKIKSGKWPKNSTSSPRAS